MKVTLSCIGDKLHEESEKENNDIFDSCAATQVFTGGALCNEATIVNDTALGGNATDRAILQFVEKIPVLKF